MTNTQKQNFYSSLDDALDTLYEVSTMISQCKGGSIDKYDIKQKMLLIEDGIKSIKSAINHQ